MKQNQYNDDIIEYYNTHININTNNTTSSHTTTAHTTSNIPPVIYDHPTTTSFSPSSSSFYLYNTTHRHLLRQLIVTGLSYPYPYTTYVTQNDGDEIINRAPMAHIKHCELYNNVISIYTPCFAYKSNYHWLQRNRHMQCMQGMFTCYII